MSSCDEKFQEIQRLQKERTKIDEDLTKVKGLQASTQFPTDDELQARFSKNVEKILDSGESKKLVDEVKAGGDVETNIPEGQPVNLKQMLRDSPAEVVEELDSLTKGLMQTGKELQPQDWVWLYDNPGRAADEIRETMGGKFTKGQVLEQISKDANTFNSAVEKTLRVRAFYQTSHDAYLDKLGDIQNFMDKSEIATQVPEKLLTDSLDLFKIALSSERQYDFVRNTWSKMGKAMQGEGFTDVNLNLIADGVPDEIDKGVRGISVEEARNMTAADFAEDSPIARVLAAADLFRTNRKEGYEQLVLELDIARIEGFDPFKIYDPSIWPDRMHRLVNTLVKDQQLFNLRTQTLNTASNAVMALYGPIRQTYEGSLYIPHGSHRLDVFRENLEASFKGYAQAIQAVRDVGKEAFLDSWNNKNMFFAGGIDTYGKFFKSTDQQIHELKRLRDWAPKSNRGKFVQKVLPFNMFRRKLHANTALWLYNKTKNPAALRPGLSALSAVDNVSGLFFHNYKLRYELEMKARRSGVQLDLMDEDGNLSNARMNDWIDKQVKEAFYDTQVTENMVKQYRKERGITNDIESDISIENRIREELVNEKYGAPVFDTEESISAGKFSEEMRFQNKPDGSKNPGKGFYDMISKLKRDNWVADIGFPYLNAPFMGASLDMNNIGLGPLIDGIRKYGFGEEYTPKQWDRVKANAIMSGHLWALFSFLSSTENIIGNGPQGEGRREWLMELEAQGKKANTIGGIPFVGGIPVISTLFLMEDFREAWQRGFISKFDKDEFLSGISLVLMGHLTRQTALMNVKQLFDVAFGDEFGRRRPLRLLGYTTAGQAKFIGPIREVERLAGAKQSQIYQDPVWTAEEEALFDRSAVDKLESKLREMVYKGFSGAALAGGKFKESDWLGTKIRLPWGVNFVRYAQHRFTPQLHPNDKVYKELGRLKLLHAPNPLATKRLSGVPIGDDVQQELNGYIGTVKGDKGNFIATVPKLRLTLDTSKEVMDSGTGMLIKVTPKKSKSKSKSKKDYGLFLNTALAEHVHNKTAIEAFNSLFNSKLYEELNKNKATTTLRGLEDKPQSEIKSELPYLLADAIKSYYLDRGVGQLRLSQTGPAVEWQQREELGKLIESQKERDDIRGLVESLKLSK